MKVQFRTLSALALLAGAFSLGGALHAAAEDGFKAPDYLITPDELESSIGTLEFNDGAPTQETADKAWDALDFNNALSVYLNSYGGASAHAIHKGFLDAGIEDNTVLIFETLMDSKSLFLTANADTVYYLSTIDLSEGPMVIEQPSGAVGTINDMWFTWIIDIGAPGPDRGEGGRYLIVPPGYDGPLPEGGFFIANSRTDHVLYAARAYLKDNVPKPAVDNVKANLKIYPYTPGGIGSSIAQALEGGLRLEQTPPAPEAKFIDGSGMAFNTIPPSDASLFDMVNANVQAEPATSYDVELLGQMAAIGIVKGKEFKPDARMQKILADAAAVGNAISRSLNWLPREELDWSYYPDSSWMSMLWQGGANFETPPPMINKDGMFEPLPPTGARTLNSRTAFYYAYTLDSPGMIMRLPRVGSQYLMGFIDADGNAMDGAETYKVVLPKDIPAAAFWSFTVYDNQTRSMLETPQGYPRAGSQSYPSPAAEAAEDGTTTVWFSPEQPEGVARGNWIQTVPGKGWFTILRLYSPLESFFTKEWRLGELELVK
jgi:hypothetical protein